MTDIESMLRDGLGDSFTRPVIGAAQILPKAKQRALARQRTKEAEEREKKRMAEEALRKASRLRLLEGLYSYKRVIRVVAAVHGIHVRDIMSDSRIQHIRDARFHVVWWLREKAKLTYPAIGKRIGRDHSSVMNAYRNVLKRKEAFDPFIAEAAKHLEQGASNGHP